MEIILKILHKTLYDIDISHLPTKKKVEDNAIRVNQ